MDIEKLLAELTLEEKASLLSGDGPWHTQPVPRLDIPAVMMSDGPHGLRRMKDGSTDMNDSIEAVCFPAASAAACSFDEDLLGKMGEAIGDSAQAVRLAVDLGPAVNIKRSPLCGRNFEYFSEDPYLAGKLAAAEVRGLQSRNVGASVKHFAANNQETRRHSVDAVVDERTLREIYLRQFEIIVKEAQPYTVMCSYNVLNGTQVSENKALLNDILRAEWGFKGLVVSDWGAVRDRVKGVAAGLDLEMPGNNDANSGVIIKAVQNGTLSMEDVDASVRRVLELVDHYEQTKKPDTVWDKEAQHKLAAEAEEECAVLLKDEEMIDPATLSAPAEPDLVQDITGGALAGSPKFHRPVLPLFRFEKVTFIGEFAEHPRYQGGGSSHINSFKVTSALDAAKEDGLDIRYVRGYDASKDEPDEDLMAEAVTAAMDSDVCVVFAGLPESYESEGYDRTNMDLPQNQLMLINFVSSMCPNTVVVLHHGSPVEMPFADDKNVRGILDMYLGGQNVGRATIDLLYGKTNPSGHLAETVPLHLTDNPSYLNFPGEGNRVEYREGIFVGYRYYDKKNMAVRYPFGYGLSYTNFVVEGIAAEDADPASGNSVKVRVKIANRGGRKGKAVVQIYVGKKDSAVIRPVRELRAFRKVELNPLEGKELEFTLDRRAFAYWNTEIHDWFVEPGEYQIYAGTSSRDLPQAVTVALPGEQLPPRVWDDNATFGDLLADPKTQELVMGLVRESQEKDRSAANQAGAGADAITPEMVRRMMEYMPLRQMVSFSDIITNDELAELIEKLNEAERA